MLEVARFESNLRERWKWPLSTDRVIFNEMLPRLEWIELAGEAEFMQTTFVGGPKHLPIRYKMRA